MEEENRGWEESLLLCQRDPYLRKVTSRVISCVGSREKNRWAVALEETLLYPEGGGQPADRGKVGSAEVIDVRRDRDGAVVCVVDRPVSGEVEVSVDWARRFDHMQQHTAQHLLTAVAQDEHNLRTTAFHLGDEVSDIELDSQSITEPTLRQIEESANELIRKNLLVTHKLVGRDELDRLEVRTRGLPDEVAEPIRLIEIEGIDLNTCGGTHVASTGELQAVKLVRTENLRGGTRVHYLAGSRVLKRLGECIDREEKLKEELSCGPEEHVEAVARLQSELRDHRREARKLRQELAQALGSSLASERSASGRQQLIAYDAMGRDSKFLQTLASTIQEKDPALWMLLTARENEAAKEGAFLLAGPTKHGDLVSELGGQVASLLEGRGGGRGGRFQGKARRLDLLADAKDLLEQRLAALGPE
jgi:alanyl-tRNA synthetase